MSPGRTAKVDLIKNVRKVQVEIRRIKKGDVEIDQENEI